MSRTLRVLAIGDPHFKINNAQETEMMVERLIEIAKDTKPDLIVNLGDTLDRHESIHVCPLKRANKFMSRLRDIAPTILIIGNHDRPNNSTFLTDDHPFGGLKEWKNLTVVDDVKIQNINGFKLLYIPYVPPGRLQEALNTVPESMDPAPDIVFSHGEYKGAKMGAVVSDTGDIWDINSPYNISGHVHDHDQLQDNLLYVGTPIPHAFGDKENKCVVLVTLNKLENSIKPSINIDKIYVNVANKIVLKVSALEAMNIKDKVDELKKTGADIKIVIKGTTTEISSVIKREELKLLTDKAKVVYDDITDEKKIKGNDTEEAIIGEQTIIVKFIDQLYTKIKDNDELLKAYKMIF
jgi:DNA repair exonuclease SbcCD nuclease subunit